MASASERAPPATVFVLFSSQITLFGDGDKRSKTSETICVFTPTILEYARRTNYGVHCENRQGAQTTVYTARIGKAHKLRCTLRE